MKTLFLLAIFLAIPYFAQAADYELVITIKEAYLPQALEYLPKGLGLPEGATTQETIDAAKQECYKLLWRKYAIGKALSKYKEADQSREDAYIEAQQALKD